MKAERQLYMALMGYLFYFYADQPQYQTFPQMLDLLQLAGKDNPSQTKTPLDIIMLGTTAEDGFQGFEEWIVANHGGDEAAAQASEEYFVIKQYKGFKSTSGSPETEASVIASCNVRLAPFAVSAVREFFSEDELELEAIGQEPTAFFLVMSDTDKTFNFILAMLLYQLFDVNTAIADKNPGSHCKIPVNCILDELANIGRIPDLDVKIATLRSRWIYITAILQSVTQLKKMYKDNADIIEGNCDTTLFLGRCDLETNKKISERLASSPPRSATAASRTAARAAGLRARTRSARSSWPRPTSATTPRSSAATTASCSSRTPSRSSTRSTGRSTTRATTSCARSASSTWTIGTGTQVRARARAPRRGRGDAPAHRGGPRVLRPRVLHVGDPRRGRPRRSTYLTRPGGSTGRQRHTGGAATTEGKTPTWLSSTSS